VKVTFKRYVNAKSEVGWSCKIDGYYITGDSSSMSRSTISRSGKRKAICEMRDFVGFIDYISDNDLCGQWEER